MNIRILMVLLSFLCTCPLWAFSCYFTMAKGKCWSKYDVSVNVLDSATNKILTTVDAPKGQLWAREKFDCNAAEKLMYIGKFAPFFWERDVGKTYLAQHYWALPGEIKPGDLAWNISVCFPVDFSLVPTPPEDDGHCACDFTAIPAITS
jgi:hypothetical protein